MSDPVSMLVYFLQVLYEEEVTMHCFENGSKEWRWAMVAHTNTMTLLGHSLLSQASMAALDMVLRYLHVLSSTVAHLAIADKRHASCLVLKE